MMRRYEAMAAAAAMRSATRSAGSENEPTSVLDLSDLETALMAMATKVFSAEGATVDRAAVHSICGSLGRSHFASLRQALEPRLRGGFDEVARRLQAAPPRLVLLEPSHEHQARLRGIARTRDMSTADMEEHDGSTSGVSSAGSTSAGNPSGGRWTSVESGKELLFQLSGLQRGFCYLLHLNEKDKLSVIFPSCRDRDNEVRSSDGTLRLPTGFYDGETRYMKFETKHGFERETFYLLSTSERLSDFAGVGHLPERFEKLPEAQAQAILAAVKQHVPGADRPRTRDMDASDFMDVSDADSNANANDVSMSLSSLMLISVAKPEEGM